MNKMYTLGTSIEVVKDHKFLATLYNTPGKTKQLCIDRHWTNFLAFQYHVNYESGTKTSCDYGFWHPPKQEYTNEIIDKWDVENGKYIFVNITDELSPQAVTMQMIQTKFCKDKALLDLIIANKSCRNSLPQYKKIFNEFSVVNDIIVRKNKIVLPKP